jgi:cytochrome c553
MRCTKSSASPGTSAATAGGEHEPCSLSGLSRSAGDVRSTLKDITLRCVAASVALLLGAGPVLAQSIAATERLCASCHGEHGLPSDQTVPIIWGQRAAYLRKQLDDYRSGDRDSEIMSSIAESLSDAQITQLATHFADAAWPVQRKPAPTHAPAAISTCKACHGPDLTGGADTAGASPRIAAQFAPYLTDTMNAYADGQRANSPAMSGLMRSLSAAQRKAIADYLTALR